MSRLPIPGGDDGQWGTVLNDYLSQSLAADGTVKPGTVGASQIADGTVSEAKLDAAVQAKLNSATSSGVTSVNTRTGAVTLTKSDVGLGNADNTSDANKPVSLATQTALNSKEPSVTAGSTGQYYRGDKSWQTLDKSAVGLGNVDNTSDATKNAAAVTLTNKTLQSPAIDKISNLTSNGVVTASGGNGTLGVTALPQDASKYLDGTGAFTSPLAMLTDRGDFAINTTYNQGDIVTYQYARWYRKTTGSGGASFTTSEWIHLGLYAVGTTSDPGGGMLWIDVS